MPISFWALEIVDWAKPRERTEHRRTSGPCVRRVRRAPHATEAKPNRGRSPDRRDPSPNYVWDSTLERAADRLASHRFNHKIPDHDLVLEGEVFMKQRRGQNQGS